MHCQEIQKLIETYQESESSTVVVDRELAIKLLGDALQERRRAARLLRKQGNNK